jgi:hypothetical protein
MEYINQADPEAVFSDTLWRLKDAHHDSCLAALAVVGTDEVGIEDAVKPRGAHLAVLPMPSVPTICGDIFLRCLRQDKP